MTAKKTTKPANDGVRKRTIKDCRSLRLNWSGRLWMVADARPAVFKTVRGALLRRPGWVRFPSIPATCGAPDPCNGDSPPTPLPDPLLAAGGNGQPGHVD